MKPIIILIIIILLIFILEIIKKYNLLVTKRNAIIQSKSSIDIYLKQRFDLIPNLVECVKGYAKHEKDLLESITNLRTQYNENKDLEKASELNNRLNQLLIIGENYPELKASSNFLNLQKNLTKMEDQLQAARRLYNIDVTNFNTLIQTFPNNVFALVFGFKAETLFELEKESNDIKFEL